MPINSYHKVKLFICLSCFLTITSSLTTNFNFINLPRKHLPFYFRNNPKILEECQTNDECEYKEWVDENSNRLIDRNKFCWGYEYDCPIGSFNYGKPICSNGSSSTEDFRSIETLERSFNHQTDFGYIRSRLNELKVLCEPLYQTDSSLECTKHLQFCRGRNLLFNFTDLINRPEPFRYKMDVLKPGQVGGYCKLLKDDLEPELTYISALQSWGPELQHFVQLHERPVESNVCNRIIEKPTVIMKLDASIRPLFLRLNFYIILKEMPPITDWKEDQTGYIPILLIPSYAYTKRDTNMYHHFCDFFNLYASLHLNATHPTAFSTDKQIVVWETFDYLSPFSDTFKAFTDYKVLDLKALRGETICFKNVILPLLPRMIFGLYYNTPIIKGCERSGLFQAFSEHILHRLKVPLHRLTDDKIRITFLLRRTQFRRILNADELIEEMKKNSSYHVRQVDFERSTKFLDQLEITRNTDIFIGMHGAGLTHSLFLPTWATLFELYHCEDPQCYRDLTRLRGIKYMTWERIDKLIQQDLGHHPDGGAHAKFTNYSFDAKEFIRLVNQAAEHVTNHRDYQEFRGGRIDINSSNTHDEF